MADVLQSDIFFFVTTIFVGVLTIAAIVAAVYILRILRNFRDISDIVKSETEHIAGDVEHLRSDLKRKGFNLPSIFRFFRSVFAGKGRSLD